MNCPKCKSPRAQLLLTSFLCTNSNCENYDRKHSEDDYMECTEQTIKEINFDWASESFSGTITTGKDVYILGRPVDIIPLNNFKLTITIPFTIIKPTDFAITIPFEI